MPNPTSKATKPKGNVKDKKWLVYYFPEFIAEGDSDYQVHSFETKEEAFLFSVSHVDDKPIIFMRVSLKLEINSEN